MELEQSFYKSEKQNMHAIQLKKKNKFQIISFGQLKNHQDLVHFKNYIQIVNFPVLCSVFDIVREQNWNVIVRNVRVNIVTIFSVYVTIHNKKI